MSLLKGFVTGPRKSSGPLMNFANFTGIRVASVFGITSPKRTSINVTSTVLTRNSNTGFPSNENKCPSNIDEMSTMRMFMQLFACRIVPNR